MTATGPITELDVRRMGPVRRLFFRRPRVSDGLVMLVVGALVITDAFQPPRQDVVVLGLALGAVAVTALWWRRRRPLAVYAVLTALFVVSVLLTDGSGSQDVAATFALYTVAATSAARTAWLAAGSGTAVMVATAWFGLPATSDPVRLENGDLEITDLRLNTLVGIAFLTLLAMAIGVSVHNRRQHVGEIVERTNALARDRDQQAELARAAERTRIAREMHDVVAHSLSVMVTLADGATAALDRSPERARLALTELSSTGRAALGDMRRVLGALQAADAPLEPTTAEGDLEALVQRFVTAGLPVHSEGLRLPPPTDTGLRLAIYRVVQESLTNVLRHAPGTERVDLTLRHEPGAWTVEVVDQGCPTLAPPSPGSGQGLIGMRERAAVLGGSVDAGPHGSGWRVRVTFPVTSPVEEVR